MTEIEAVLNSRPLSYVSMDDLEEPLTPSHLLSGYRVLSLPDPSLHDDPDPNYGESAQDLSRRMKHLMKTLEKFWKRWRKEYSENSTAILRSARVFRMLSERARLSPSLRRDTPEGFGDWEGSKVS